MINLQGMISYL